MLEQKHGIDIDKTNAPANPGTSDQLLNQLLIFSTLIVSFAFWGLLSYTVINWASERGYPLHYTYFFIFSFAVLIMFLIVFMIHWKNKGFIVPEFKATKGMIKIKRVD